MSSVGHEIIFVFIGSKETGHNCRDKIETH